MRIDVVLPGESPGDRAPEIVDLAVRAEQLGFGAVYLPDHLIPPAGYGPRYGGVFEAVTLLAAIAARTSRIRLGTSVLVLPLRDPFLLAKQTATVDALAPGRVTLGVGAGWEAAEFDVLGVPFAGRGRRMDAALAVIRHLHTVGSGPYEGPEYSFGRGEFAPRPQHPVEILVGGISRAALARAARYADVWQGFDLAPREFTALRAALDEVATRSVAAGVRIGWDGSTPVDDLRREVDAWREVDPGHLAVWLGGTDGVVGRLEAVAALM